MRRDARTISGGYFGELIMNKQRRGVLSMMSTLTLYNFYLLSVWPRRSIDRSTGSNDFLA